MSTSTAVRIYVKDIFTFDEGKTVIAGKVLEGPKFIRGGEVEVLVDGKSLGKIRLDGERMDGNYEMRSFSTSHSALFSAKELKDKEVTFTYLT